CILHINTCILFFFFLNTIYSGDYTLSLHDALPIWESGCRSRRRDRVHGSILQPPAAGHSPLPADRRPACPAGSAAWLQPRRCRADRKSTRLNSSHVKISYAVFCLKKKKIKRENRGI